VPQISVGEPHELSQLSIYSTLKTPLGKIYFFFKLPNALEISKIKSPGLSTNSYLNMAKKIHETVQKRRHKTFTSQPRNPLNLSSISSAGLTVEICQSGAPGVDYEVLKQQLKKRPSWIWELIQFREHLWNSTRPCEKSRPIEKAVLLLVFNTFTKKVFYDHQILPIAPHLVHTKLAERSKENDRNIR